MIVVNDFRHESPISNWTSSNYARSPFLHSEGPATTASPVDPVTSFSFANHQISLTENPREDHAFRD